MRVPVLATLIAVTVSAAATPALAASATIGTRPHAWSTAVRVVHQSPASAPEVTGIRVGHHPGFDHIVIDIRGHAPGFTVGYVRRLHADPSGKVVDLLGPASLRIALNPANGHDTDTGDSTLMVPAQAEWRLDEVRETAVIGDFEAVFTVGAGLAHKSPFRVQTLREPTRIVVDVRH